MTDRDFISGTKTTTDVPIPLRMANPRPSLARGSPETQFLSQLIAERDNLPAQRLRRRATVGFALGAYSDGEQRSTRRLPRGSYLSRTI